MAERWHEEAIAEGGEAKQCEKEFQASFHFGRSEAIEYDGHVGVAYKKHPPDEW